MPKRGPIVPPSFEDKNLLDSIPAEVRQVVALEIINATDGRRYLTATATETELVFSRYP